MRAEKMKTLVRVLGQHQAGEQPGRFFLRLRLCLAPFVFRRCVLALSVSRLLVAVTAGFDLLQRLEIHFAIRAVQKRKLARQSVAE